MSYMDVTINGLGYLELIATPHSLNWKRSLPYFFSIVIFFNVFETFSSDGVAAGSFFQDNLIFISFKKICILPMFACVGLIA